MSFVYFSDIILEDNENDPVVSANGVRQSRPGRRPPRPVVSSGREREFPIGNGDNVAEVASSAAAVTEEADALLRKLRAL